MTLDQLQQRLTSIEQSTGRIVTLLEQQAHTLSGLTTRARRQETRLCALAEELDIDIGQNTRETGP